MPPCPRWRNLAGLSPLPVITVIWGELGSALGTQDVQLRGGGLGLTLTHLWGGPVCAVKCGQELP